MRARRMAGGEARHQEAPGLEDAAPRHGRRHRPDRRVGADRQGCRRRLPGDGSQVGPLLDRVDGRVASFAADGAYDRDDVCAGVAARRPSAAVAVPPRSGAVPSGTAGTAPTRRGRHLQVVAGRGRTGWQKASGYDRRAPVEAGISRWKRVVGDGPRAQTHGHQRTGVGIAADVPNRMLGLGRPEYVRTA